MIDQAPQAFGDGSPGPEPAAAYRADWVEMELPSRPSDPGRNPALLQGPAGEAPRSAAGSDEAGPLDLRAGVGEDPGWHRVHLHPRWRGSSQARRPVEPTR